MNSDFSALEIPRIVTLGYGTRRYHLERSFGLLTETFHLVTLQEC